MDDLHRLVFGYSAQVLPILPDGSCGPTPARTARDVVAVGPVTAAEADSILASIAEVLARGRDAPEVSGV